MRCMASSRTAPISCEEISVQSMNTLVPSRRVTIPRSVTSIGQSAFGACPRLTLRGYRGSAAEQYAREHGVPFSAI